ncbi:prepilin peptidase-dependent protein [Serratia microhaemolytica]|uniref:prepilin peptidase-dependent protein n=1 Tax=Serratia microhaemolytica TaxID=2675110 RepID=UPI000FDD9108|nr:prepilin peptidase-dependent protein [Serratia microhaemolytica]
MSALERGFTLPEMMLAITFGTVITLAAAKTLPILRQQALESSRHHRLVLALQQAAFAISKDLQRSGFCAGHCQGRALLISQLAGEATNSCVIIAYDLNRNGQWEPSGEADYFGYRLRAGALETQRGVSHCQGSGWERLLDQEEVTLSTFTLQMLNSDQSQRVLQLDLAGHATTQQKISHRLRWLVRVGAT